MPQLLTAQEAGWRRHPGRVVLESGEPVGGAMVVFVPIAMWGARDVPVSRARSVGDGRFVVQLREACPHVAYAVAPDGQASRVIHEGWESTTIQIAKDGHGNRGLVDIGGGDAWIDKGGTFRAYLGASSIAESTQGSAAGARVVQLRDVPFDGMMLEAHRSARCVGQWTWHPSLRFDVPTLKRVGVRVIDEHGRGLAGVSVSRLLEASYVPKYVFPHRDPMTRQLVGETGADGSLSTSVLTIGEPGVTDESTPLLFVVEKKGWRAKVVGFGSRPFSGRSAVRLADNVLDVALERSSEVEGVNGTQDGLIISHLVPMSEILTQLWEVSWGSRSVDCPDTGRVVAKLVRPTGSAGVGSALPWPYAVRLNASSLDVARIRVEVRTADGGPAVGSWVMISQKLDGDDFLAPDLAGRYRADSRGMLDVGLALGQFVVVATHKDGFAMAEGHCNGGKHSFVVDMKPMESMRIRVVDSSGKPVVGAQATRIRAKDVMGAPGRERFDRALLYHMQEAMCGESTSNAEGLMVILCVPGLVRQQVDIAVPGGRAVTVELRPTDEVGVVRLR